jgi:broad specificity phosphatase PhoE
MARSKSGRRGSGTAEPGRIVDDAIAAATSWGAAHLEVILLRHGQPKPDARRRADERLDPPLSELGRRQAKATGTLLSSEPVTAVYTSDLDRAAQTARIVADALGLSSRPVPQLREIELGGAVTAAGAGLDAAGWHQAAAEFATGGRWDTLVPAEPGPRFRDRVRAAIGAIAARHGTDRTNGTTVIACHNGVINAHLADVLGLDRDYALRPAHASLTRCWYAAGRWTVYSVNETAHLAAELRTS